MISQRQDGMNNDNALRLGVAGLGGYAERMADLVLEAGPTSDPPATLVAVCDPAPEAHPKRVAELRDRGVEVYAEYGTMLGEADLEGVWLPVPIALHVPFAERALRVGVAVMVEKPVAGTVDDLDRLIAARDAAGLPVLVGFQDIYDPHTLPMKRRLLAREFGELTSATLRFCSPRTDTYFNRNDWAGSLRRHETWTLDSPVNNAMAHFVNLALFLLGPTEAQSVRVKGIEAELYRAARIENYDTASLRIHIEAGPSLLVLMSHATAESDGPLLRLEGSAGTVERDFRNFIVNGKAGETDANATKDMRHCMLEAFARSIRGLKPFGAVADLEVARAHTLVVNGASQATAVRTISRASIEEQVIRDGRVQSVPALLEAVRFCGEQNLMLHESGRLDFTEPAGHLDLTDYHHFVGPHPETLAANA